MQKIWQFIGVCAFWLTWPLLYMRLYKTNRVRVAILHDDKLLLVKSWYGSGRWQLPGGGIKSGESAAKAASREVKEEVGIPLQAKNLRKLSKKSLVNERGLKYNAQAFIVYLQKKPDIRRSRLEIAEYCWLGDDELTIHQGKLSASARRALAAMEKLT